MPADEYVVVGRIGSPYGIRGWLNLKSFTDPPDNLLSYQPWYLGKDRRGSWHPVEISSCKPHKQAFVAKLDGCDDRDVAASQVGLWVAVPASALPQLDEDEFYWRDLQGIKVINTAGEMLGTVRQIMETGAHDILVVQRPESAKQEPTSADDKEPTDKKQKGDLLVPFTKPYLLDVDVAGKQITVDWQADW